MIPSRKPVTGIKKVILIISLLVGFTLCSQVSAQTKNHHLIGMDIGYASWPGRIGYKGEANLNYFYAFKHFCAKLELGASPSTNFGTLKKVFVTTGFTTNLNKLVSAHIMVGLGGIPGSNTYEADGFSYDYETNGVLFSGGIYYQPLNDNKLFLGLNVTSTKYAIYPLGWLPASVFDTHTTTGNVVFVNVSFNYKLNGKKRLKAENKETQ